MTKPLPDDAKIRIEQKTLPNGSVSVRIFGQKLADVQAEVNRIMEMIDNTNGGASFFGPLRVNFGYVAVGNYHLARTLEDSPWGA